jgi:hypothetical protein
MFDEPGVFLHPSGQYDLMQVLETLSQENQILYVTHSLFMLNKTFPQRHRLIQKNESGTTLNGKPYTGKWEAAISALGLTLTGTILFANQVLLVEGASDPIYLYAILQAAVGSGQFDLDLNALSIMATSDERHAELLIGILLDTSPKPSIAVMVDGDKSGKLRLDYLAELLKHNGIVGWQLPKDCEVEDHLPMLEEVYLPALAAYTSKLTQPAADQGDLETKLRNSYAARGKTNIDKWSEAAVKEITGVTKISKIGLAREYAARLSELDRANVRIEAGTKELIQRIKEAVGLKGRLLESRDIFQGEKR